MSRGFAVKSSSVRTSTRTGQCAVPIRRASLSTEMVLIDDMVRPHLLRDAMLRHVASWGDRKPHAAEISAAAPVCQDRLLGGRGRNRRMPTQLLRIQPSFSFYCAGLSAL